MNDVPEGEGSTSFPELSLRVQPKKNHLLTWPNFISTNRIDPRVVHLAEEIQGEEIEKIVMNIWINEVDQSSIEDNSEDSSYEEGKLKEQSGTRVNMSV